MHKDQSPVNTTKLMFTLLGLILASLFALFAYATTLPIEERILWLKEDGIIEILSALGYFVAAAGAVVVGGIAYLKKYFYFIVLIVACGLRELDFHKRLTTMSISKTKFFVSPDVPMGEKIFGLIVILFLAYMVFLIIKHHGKDFLLRIKALDPIYIGGISTFFMLGLSKTLDGFSRKLGDFGIVISKDAGNLASTWEEIIEIGIPMTIIATYCVYFLDRKQRKNRL